MGLVHISLVKLAIHGIRRFAISYASRSHAKYEMHGITIPDAPSPPEYASKQTFLSCDVFIALKCSLLGVVMNDLKA